VSRFAAAGDGIGVRLGAAEVAILARLPSLLGSVGADAGDPAVARLHPAAYPESESESTELIRLTEEDLALQRRVDLEVFTGALQDAAGGVEISRDDAEAWLRVLEAARIVLAARRGLFDLSDLSEASIADPDVALVSLMGMYQQELAEALLATMRPA
jgi:hypothetical protein